MLERLWERERPLSPELIRSSLTVLGILLASWAAVAVVGSLFRLLTLNIVGALTQFIGGIAIPLTMWIGIRLLADLVILQNQAAERLGSGPDSKSDAVETVAPADASATK